MKLRYLLLILGPHYSKMKTEMKFHVGKNIVDRKRRAAASRRFYRIRDRVAVTK